MNRLTKLSIAIGAAICAGTAMADVPNQVGGNDYDQYTVDATGNIVLDNAGNCPIGGTCTVLEATGTGILQQRVEYAGGGTFFQTIIVDDGAVSVADPSTLGFRIENYVSAENNNPGNFATLSVVQGGTAGVDAFVTEFEGAEGTLVSAGGPATETIHQLNENGNATRASEFFFEDAGGAGNRMVLNYTAGNNEGQMTLRRAEGVYVPVDGTLELDSGDQIAYLAGANLQVVYVTQAASGAGSALDRVFGLTNATDGTTVISQNNVTGQGIASVTSSGVAGDQVVGAGPFLTTWDTGMFGAEPSTYVSNGGTGVTAPAGGFFPAAPTWVDIVP